MGSKAEDKAEIAEIAQELSGLPQALASHDGRKADKRPITDRDIELHVTPHVAENYAALVASRHGGDWTALADSFDAEGDFENSEGRTANVRAHRVLSTWARKRAAESTPDDPAAPPADPTTTPPKGRTAPPKSTT